MAGVGLVSSFSLLIDLTIGANNNGVFVSWLEISIQLSKSVK